MTLRFNKDMTTSKNRFEKGKWVECAECDESRRSNCGLAVFAGEFTVGVGVRLLPPVVLHHVNIVGAVLMLVVVLAVLVEAVEVSGHGIRSISPRFQPLGGLFFVCDRVISRIFDIISTFIRYFIIFRFRLI